MNLHRENVARSLDTFVGCPHCRSAVDVTVETHLAMIGAINMMWEAFCEQGLDVEGPSQDLVVELERRINERRATTAIIRDFVRETSLDEPAGERSFLKRFLDSQAAQGGKTGTLRQLERNRGPSGLREGGGSHGV